MQKPLFLLAFRGHNKGVLKQTQMVSAEWAAAQDAGLWLTSWEQERGQSFSSMRRRADWLAGRLAVKKLLWEQWDIAPLSCEVGTDGVAPVLAGLRMPAVNISLSHCAERGAASWEHNAQGTVGVDIQQVRPVHRHLAGRILSSGERGQDADADVTRLLLFWALKEAAIKACRRPYRRALREIAVTLRMDGTASITLPGAEHPLAAEYIWTDGAWLARAVLPKDAP